MPDTDLEYTVREELIQHEYATVQQIMTGCKVCPLPLSVIPNYMGINLCSVHSISWSQQTKDKQLVSLTINFLPAEQK